DALHRAAIIHREIRHDHVLVASDGRVTVIDFGYVTAPVPRVPDRRLSPTSTGRTPPYRFLSPEQALGRHVDSRTDLYSAMVVTCELVAGRRLVEAANDLEVLIAIRDGNFPIPPLPAALAEVARRTLVPADLRVATATELRDLIEEAAAHANLELGPHVIARTLCELGVPV